MTTTRLRIPAQSQDHRGDLQEVQRDRKAASASPTTAPTALWAKEKDPQKNFKWVGKNEDDQLFGQTYSAAVRLCCDRG